MRSSFAVRTGSLQLARTPNYRQQAARRRWLLAGALLGLAAVGGAVGSLTAPSRDSVASPTSTGPFSYFPSE